MGKLASILSHIWHLKHTIIFFLLVLPLIFLMYSLNKPPVFTAVQTLSLQTDQAQSSLLRHIHEPNFARILSRQLRSDVLVKNALRDVGTLLDGTPPQEEKAAVENLQNNLQLTAAGQNVIEITLKHTDSRQILRLLEAVVINFTDTLMAPERFAKDELASSLGGQIQLLTQLKQETEQQILIVQGKLKKAKPEAERELERQLTALEFQAQTLHMQKSLAENQYQEALELAQQTKFSPIIKPESDPIILHTQGGADQHIHFFSLGILVAAALSTLLVSLRALADTSLKHDKDIRREVGLRILGHMPNLGNIQFDEGRISTMPRLNL